MSCCPQFHITLFVQANATATYIRTTQLCVNICVPMIPFCPAQHQLSLPLPTAIHPVSSHCREYIADAAHFYQIHIYISYVFILYA